MLRTAYFAQQAGASASLITAALLHDYGYLIHVDAPTDQEQIGADFLAEYFKPAITEPIRLHIAAKRYLCAVEPNYMMSLSPISQQNLRWQGGPFNPAQVKYFECLPYFTDAIQLRHYHEMSQQAILAIPKVEYFRPFLETGLKE